VVSEADRRRDHEDGIRKQLRRRESHIPVTGPADGLGRRRLPESIHSGLQVMVD